MTSDLDAILKRIPGLFLAAFLLAIPVRGADLRGHGGPVRSISVSLDGETAITGSFDSTAIVWSLSRAAAIQVLRAHEGVVNAAVAIRDDLFATAGEDGRLLIWRKGANVPVSIWSGHTAPVAALAVSPDRQRVASAAWDGTVRIWPVAGGDPIVLDGHGGNVNGVAFLSDGIVVSAAYDGALRVFAPDGTRRSSFNLGAPLSAIAIAKDGEIIVAAADGKLRFVDPSRGLLATAEIAEAPLVALAVSPDGALVATAGFRGALAIIDRARRAVAQRLEGPAFPLWSLAFSQDGKEILTGGSDRLVRRWSIATGEPSSPALALGSDDIPERLKTHPGAEVFKACVACHTLSADGGNRAGPTLSGLYGRRIATAAGYDFSPALRAMDIVWSPETLQRLFEIGPAAYTPGTKMPEQKVANGDDRKALAEFIGLIGSPR
jgi:cytochrome c